MFNLVTASMVKANNQSSARTKGIDIGLFTQAYDSNTVCKLLCERDGLRVTPVMER